MKVSFIHPASRERIELPASQVVVTDDTGRPLAVSYESSGIVVHADLNDGDFEQVCKGIGLGNRYEKPQALTLKQ